MKRKSISIFKKATAGFLTLAMCITSLSTYGMGTVLADAPETPTASDRVDDSIVYFVDCGDLTPATVSEGDQLGTHNSVTDQAYGADEETGYYWGVFDGEELPKQDGGWVESNATPPASGLFSEAVYTANTWAQENIDGGETELRKKYLHPENLPKTVTNRYTKNFNEKNIDPRFLQYKFQLEPGKYEVVVGLANPWGCADSPQVYLNYVDGADNVVLQENISVPDKGSAAAIGTYTITGSGLQDMTVDIRGTGSDNLAINLAYIRIQSIDDNETEDQIKVRRDITALYLPEIMMQDYILPTSGSNGSTITWESDKDNIVVSGGTVAVTRPETGQEDAEVTLTATARNNDAESKREFKVTVPASKEKNMIIRDDSTIKYFVDCGDYVVETVSDGDQFGTHNSVTEQVYQEDLETGYKWGIIDTTTYPTLKNGFCNNGGSERGGVTTDNTWPNEWAGTIGQDNIAKTSTNRYSRNQAAGNCKVEYAFELESGKYEIIVSCVKYWNNINSISADTALGDGEAQTLGSCTFTNVGDIQEIKGEVTIPEEDNNPTQKLSLAIKGIGSGNDCVNVTHILIKHIHELTKVEAKEATCTSKGNKEYWKCSNCEEIFSDAEGSEKTTLEEVTIAELPHEYENVTDNEDGTHSAKCKVCNQSMSSESHKGGTATCIAKAKCEVCNAEYGEIDDDNHVNTEIQGSAAATCTEPGNMGNTYCNDCKKVVENGEVIPAAGHKLGKTEFVDGAYVRICETCNTKVALEQAKLTFDDILPYYNVDCGDYDVTTAPEGEDFGKYQSVTEQVYGADTKTNKKWGIVDDYAGTVPDGNKADSGTGGIQTNWTWPQENPKLDVNTSKTITNRYTKNQSESSATFGNTRKLDYKFELEPGTYQVKMLFKDPWTNVSKEPTVTLKSGDSTKVTKDVTAGTEVKMDVTVDEGDNELAVSMRGTKANTAAINVAYITITKPEYENLYETYVLAKVDSKVYRDFQLAEGLEDTEIVWTSDNNAITINGNQAVVIRGKQDQTVNLKARIQKDNYYVEKTFQTVVKAESADNDFIAISNFNNLDVEVQDAYYRNAYDKEVAYLVSLDTDRLLAGFRETAAYAAGMNATERATFMKNKARYDGWENTKIGGHAPGHYMSAIAQAYVNPQATAEQKAALLQKINKMVDGLAECQEKTIGSNKCKEGYLFGATITSNETSGTGNLEYQFDNVTKVYNTNSVWVPWYTMHKILAGLVDCYKYAGNEKALDVAVNLGMWTYNRVGSLPEADMQAILGVEYGGMNDALYELYDLIRKNEKYEDKAANILKAAEQFDETSLFESVRKGGKNVLDGKHANTTIPKFIGALKRYIVLGESEEDYLEYAEKFWDMVINNHSYITGGNSENEHFGPDNILYAEETAVNNETCNTYNMLKFSRELFKITGDSKYSDYYENTLINAIMSSQNPDTGMSMYFQPMATGYQKVFGKPTTDFWCCTGSGMENFGKLNDSIYFHTDDTMIVNLYISSEVKWNEKNVKVTQTSGISDISSENAMFKVESLDGSEASVNLALRIPDWVVDEGNTMTVEVNGTKVTPKYYDFEENETYADAAGQNKYAYITVKSGDTVKITTPMKTVAYNLPDNANAYAFKYGPVVLSAKLGHDPSKQQETGHGIGVRKPSVKAVNSDNISIYAAESVEDYMANIDENLVREEGKNSFKLKGASFNYEFVPHYSQYTDNYGIYWVYSIGGRSSEDVLNEKDTNRKDRVTIGSVQAGYGQYEPGLGDTGNTGSSTEHIRYANAGGYFTYEMKVDTNDSNYLLLTLRKEDNGKPLHISVVDKGNGSSTGVKLYDNDSVSSESNDAIQGMLSSLEYGDYYEIRIPVTEDAMKKVYKNEDGDDVILVKYEGTSDKASAALYNWSYVVRPYKTTNHLKSFTINGTEMKFDANNKCELWLSDTSADSVKVHAEIADTSGYVAVNGSAIEENNDVKVSLKGLYSDYKIEVFAEDFECVETYTIKIGMDTGDLDLDYAKHIKKYYSFDDTLGDAYPAAKATVPSEVKNKTLTYGNGANENTKKAVYLDGNNGLAFGDAADLGESYTISYWMKPDAILGVNDPTFCAGVFGGTDTQYWVNLTHDGKIWSHKGGYINTPASNAYVANEWQHVTLVVDGSKDGSANNTVTAMLYVNGNVVTSGNIAKGIMTNANAKLYFGVNQWDAYFKGYLDELIMMDTALSAIEVKSLYDGEIDASGKVEIPESPVISVIKLIKEIGDVEYTEASKEKIDAARTAYNKLTEAQKASIESSIVLTLTNAERSYADKKAESQGVTQTVDGVIELIQAIGKVEYTEASKKKIDAARNAYNSLIKEQKDLVPGDILKLLADAEKTYTDKKEQAENISISKCTITGIASKYYFSGKAIKPAVKVMYGTKVLVNNKDYTVEYKNNTNIGKATVTIKGKGSYTGTVPKEFKITVKKKASYTIGNYKYKITKAAVNGKGTVSVTGAKSKKLKSIKVANSVKIGGVNFKVTAINANAFKGFKKATKVTIGSNVKTIGKNAFNSCTVLKKVTIGKGVASIESKAFYGCKKLTSVTIKGKVLKKVKKDAFKKTNKKLKVKVPKAKKKAYKKLIKSGKVV